MITSDKAIDIVEAKLTNKRWIDRAADMIRHFTVSNTNPDCRISNLRVNPAWPMTGSISFTRAADGKRITLKLVGSKFKGTAN